MISCEVQISDQESCSERPSPRIKYLLTEVHYPVKELLKQLHRVLESTDSVDPDTLKQVKELDDEVNRLLETGSSGVEVNIVVDQAKAVETRFAVDHPVAERFLREIIDTLSRVGI